VYDNVVHYTKGSGGYGVNTGNGNFAALDPSNPYADAQAEQSAALQKWVLDDSTQSWQLPYTLQNGLDLGRPYAVPGYSTADNVTQAAPACRGLRPPTACATSAGASTPAAVLPRDSGAQP
jgi:hypothetical protein